MVAMENNQVRIEREPRWPAFLSLFAIGVLSYGLPESLNLGPGWLLPLLVSLLLIPTLITHVQGDHDLARKFGYLALGVVTAFMTGSLILLIAGLSTKAETPIQLLISAGLLWACNVLIFASWYWKLDGGGPYRREALGLHEAGAFLFPQMTLDEDLRARMGQQNWKPAFMDYLFLAFNTSTAFSPTDVPVLTRWAKAMMMVQASVSLVTLALLAARAVNVL
jgi:hypothetical protein